MSTEITLSFPEKQSLGSLYTAEREFPHQRKWIGEARGKLSLSCAPDRMLGVALGSAGWDPITQMNASDLSRLKSLDFSTSQFGERTFKPSQEVHELVEVRLDFLRITGSELRLLKTLPNLKTVWLTGASIADGDMKEFATFSSLFNLVLKSTAVTDQGIANLGGLDSLEILTLPQQITDAGLSGLKHMKRLKRLDLSNTKITDAGLRQIGELSSLSELYLNDTNVADECIQHLASLPALRLLFLSGTRVTDAGLSQLEQIAHLEHLELRDTKATEIGLARLRARLPQCAIFGP